MLPTIAPRYLPIAKLTPQAIQRFLNQKQKPGAAVREKIKDLGHSQIGITMNTYSHCIPAMQREVADKMDQILSPVATPAESEAKSLKPN